LLTSLDSAELTEWMAFYALEQEEQEHARKQAEMRARSKGARKPIRRR